MEHYILSDGYKVPKVGFGTDKMKGADGIRRIEMALNNGYRLLDTAFNYENEGTVGRAIRNSSVPRDQITIASKLPGRHHAYQAALDTIEESVLRTGLDYIDLYLIHWPNPKQEKYVEAWQALIDAQKTGLVRSIGVSNFLPEHIERLEKETGVLPVINQIELHPYFNQAEQRAYNASRGIVTQAWSPLGRDNASTKEDIILEIANKYGKSPAQVVLRWDIEQNVLPIPKSTHVGRQAENLAIFDFSLTTEEIEKINSISRQDGRNKGQNPAEYEEF